MFVCHRLAPPKVVDVGYVPVNAALLAKMQIRIEKRGNEEADYVSGQWSFQDPKLEVPTIYKA